jgi:hypothetical protein
MHYLREFRGEKPRGKVATQVLRLKAEGYSMKYFSNFISQLNYFEFGDLAEFSYSLQPLCLRISNSSSKSTQFNSQYSRSSSSI